jgi:hypothetical protein
VSGGAEVADKGGEVWITAEVRIGAELAKMPKAKGNAGPGRGKAGAKAGPAFSDAPTLKEIGFSNKKRAASAKRLAEMPAEGREKIITELKDAGKAVTPAAVLTAARQFAIGF